MWMVLTSISSAGHCVSPREAIEQCEKSGIGNDEVRIVPLMSYVQEFIHFNT